MAFAQINYQQKLGNGKYTLAEAGCFVTAFCNLLLDFKETVSPSALNSYLISHNQYLRDPDGAKEDCSWYTITGYEPKVRVTKVVDHGTRQTNDWPKSNEAIVKFYYKGHSGEWTSHFCKVYNYKKKQILDSWDGKVKTVGKGSYYGEPVGYATYALQGAQKVTPVQPAASKPSAQPTKPYTIEKITPKLVQLNKNPTSLWNLNDTSWSSFSTNPVSHSKKGAVITVVAIAHHKLGGDYYMPDAGKAAGYNTVDCSAYTPPKPAPPAAQAPKPAAQPKPANTTYIKLDAPENFVTNKQPTKKWRLDFPDDAHATSVEDLDQGTSFLAYGKAQRTDLDRPAYYMDEADFGAADTTGIPVSNVGINVVDLNPIAAQPAAEIAAASDGTYAIDGATVSAANTSLFTKLLAALFKLLSFKK